MKRHKQKRSKNLLRRKGKFWPAVRQMIWQKAQEIFQEENLTAMKKDFHGITATRSELREGGYFYRAKIIVLRNLWYASKNQPSLEEREIMGRYGSQCQ